MEHLENNIIRKKLESLEELPSNYDVNLASKFDLVMQANQPKKKNYLLWLAVPASIAASFILFLIFGQSNISSTQIASKVQKHQTTKFNSIKPQKQMAIGFPIRVKNKKVISPAKKVESKTITVPQIAVNTKQENKTEQIDSLVSEIQIASNNPNQKQKKSRFREIDFNEQVDQVNFASEAKKEASFIKFKFPDRAAVNSIQPDRNFSYRQSF
jgi:hypothetical protein